MGVRKVGLDYHVEVEGHFYSVPYRHARTQVEVCFTARTVEVFASGDRIAVHLRGSGDGKHTTLSDHMPSSHRRYGDWTIERILREARAIGPLTEMLSQMLLEERPHPEQGFRTCLGVVRLVGPHRAQPVSRPPAAAPWRLGPRPTARSSRSWTTTWIASRRQAPTRFDAMMGKAFRRCTPRPSELAYETFSEGGGIILEWGGGIKSE